MTESQSNPNNVEDETPSPSNIPELVSPRNLTSIPPSAAHLKQSQGTEQSPTAVMPETDPCGSSPNTEVDPQHTSGSMSAPLQEVKISFGENEPEPRWVIDVDCRLPPSWQTEIEGVNGVTRPVQPISTASSTTARARPTSDGKCPLRWTFETGYKKGWNGRPFNELLSQGYLALAAALDDRNERERFTAMIRNGQYAHLVRNVEDPLPGLPRPVMNYVRLRYIKRYGKEPIPEDPEYQSWTRGRSLAEMEYLEKVRPLDERYLGRRTAKMRRDAWGNGKGLSPSLNPIPNRKVREMAPSPEIPVHNPVNMEHAPMSSEDSPRLATADEQRVELRLRMGHASNEKPPLDETQHAAKPVGEVVSSGGLEEPLLPGETHQPPALYETKVIDWAIQHLNDGALGKTQQVPTNIKGPKAASTPRERAKSNPQKRKAKDQLEVVHPRRNPLRKARQRCRYVDD